MNFEHFSLSIENHVAHLAFDRPDKSNSLTWDAWMEMKSAFETLSDHPEVRTIILSGNGRHFCAGIDLSLLMEINRYREIDCEARKREKLRTFIYDLQACINAIESCNKPVIAAINGFAYGGGCELALACTFRLAMDAVDPIIGLTELNLGIVIFS